MIGWKAGIRTVPCRRPGENEVPMLIKLLLSRILDNDSLTRGLGDPEARMLVEWLVEQAEDVAGRAPSEQLASREVDGLCRRARAIGRFVELWGEKKSRGAAGQLAVAEGFTWPLPPPAADPCEIMQSILAWEARHLPHCAA